MKMIIFLKYFSLLSLILSIVVYFLPIREMGINTEIFFILHFTSLVAFGGMIFHSMKRSKKQKFNFNISKIFNDYRIKFLKLKIICQHKPIFVLTVFICIILIFGFIQYHVQYFLANVGHQSDENSVAGFVELAAGHWIIFSSIPTFYFFFGIPLKKTWDNIEIG